MDRTSINPFAKTAAKEMSKPIPPITISKSPIYRRVYESYRYAFSNIPTCKKDHKFTIASTAALSELIKENKFVHGHEFLPPQIARMQNRLKAVIIKKYGTFNTEILLEDDFVVAVASTPAWNARYPNHIAKPSQIQLRERNEVTDSPGDDDTDDDWEMSDDDDPIITPQKANPFISTTPQKRGSTESRSGVSKRFRIATSNVQLESCVETCLEALETLQGRLRKANFCDEEDGEFVQNKVFEIKFGLKSIAKMQETLLGNDDAGDNNS